MNVRNSIFHTTVTNNVVIYNIKMFVSLDSLQGPSEINKRLAFIQVFTVILLFRFDKVKVSGEGLV